MSATPPDRARDGITVVVPTHNDGPWLHACLASVTAQTLTPERIVVVDDGSTDPSTAERAVAGCAHAVLIRQPNAGAAAARNRGLAEVATEWVAFVDSDDAIAPTSLATRLALVEGDERIGAAYTGFVARAADGTTSHSRFRVGTGPLLARDLGRPGGVPGGLPLHLLRTRAVREIGGLDPALVLKEDFDLLIRMGRAGWRVTGTNEPLYHRTLRPGSLSRGSARARWRGERPFLNKAWTEGYYSRPDLLWQEAIGLALLVPGLTREAFGRHRTGR